MNDNNCNINDVTYLAQDPQRGYKLAEMEAVNSEGIQQEYKANDGQLGYQQDGFFDYQQENMYSYDQNNASEFQVQVRNDLLPEYQAFDSESYQHGNQYPQGNILSYSPSGSQASSSIHGYQQSKTREYHNQQNNITTVQSNGNNETPYASQLSLNTSQQFSQQLPIPDTAESIHGILQMEGSVEPNGPILGGKGYIPAQTIQKAYYDLGETPEIKSACLRGFRQQIEINQEENNFDEHSDAFLLKFLRSRKFDVEAAYSLLEKYYNVRENKPEVFRNLTKKNVRRTMEQGIVGVLPQRDKKGRAIVIFNFNGWNMSLPFHFEKLLRVFVFTLEKLFESEETQINGIVVISNLAQLSVLQTKNLGAPMITKLLEIFQDNLPFRINAVHLLNPPWHFKLLWKMVDPLTKIKAKIARRIYIHDGDLSRFQAEFEAELLPKDLGGKCPPYDNKLWVQELLDPEHRLNNTLQKPATPNRRRSPSPARKPVNRYLSPFGESLD